MATSWDEGGTGYVARRESLISPWIFVKEFQAAHFDFFQIGFPKKHLPDAFRDNQNQSAPLVAVRAVLARWLASPSVNHSSSSKNSLARF